MRLDAAYCLAAGVLVLVLEPVLGHLFGVPPSVLLAAGLGSVAWALAIVALHRALHERVLLVLGLANVAGAALLGAGAALVAAAAGQLLLALTAAEVAGFAAAQLAVGRRPPR